MREDQDGKEKGDSSVGANDNKGVHGAGAGGVQGANEEGDGSEVGCSVGGEGDSVGDGSDDDGDSSVHHDSIKPFTEASFCGVHGVQFNDNGGVLEVTA